MSGLRIGRVLAVVAAVSLLTGLAPAPADAAGICRKAVSAAGKPRIFWLARGAARTAWRKKVIGTKGRAWARWQRARGHRYRCKFVSGGLFQSVCVAVARPCRRR